MERTQQHRVVIVSQPGMMREGLLAFLSAFPNLEIAACVSGALSALNVIRRRPPPLLIIDSNVPEEEATALLQRIKQDWPGVACLVFGNASRQRQWWLAAGADEMLSRYGSTEALEVNLQRLLLNSVK